MKIEWFILAVVLSLLLWVLILVPLVRADTCEDVTEWTMKELQEHVQTMYVMGLSAMDNPSNSTAMQYYVDIKRSIDKHIGCGKVGKNGD